MKLLLSLMGAVAVLLCGGCATSRQPDPGEVYSGTYFYNFESSSFTPDGTDEAWCLSGNMEQAELPAKGASGPWGTAHVVVRGTLSPPGHYCNMGASKFVLKVSQVLKVSDKRAREP
jgi:hypothetical protein